MNDLECVECGQKEAPMLVFVVTLMYEDGTVEDLPEGMHPYCALCREKLNITDELNAGRDLRAEAKQVVIDAERRAGHLSVTRKQIGVVMDALEPWVGGTDGIFAMLGRRPPERPQEVFDGVSDAFAELDPATMTPSMAIAFISATYSVKDRIENWRGFVSRAHEHFKTIMSEDEARGNLVGFLK